MKWKAFSYFSAFIVSSYVVYLDYIFLQGAVWNIVKFLFRDVSRYSVHVFVRYLFYLTGAFVILIYTMYFIFYLYFKENERTKPAPKFFPKVSLVIPAYNEAMNIERLIESIQYQDYPFECYEIILVDDGSSDSTSEIAERYGVKVIRHEKNMGKAKALEDGIKVARGNVIITMDADSYFADGSSLRIIVQNLFTKPSVGVSTGVIRVEERDGSFIEKFQVIEYLHSFEVGRRVQSYLDWLLVVPGAFSAFKGHFIKSLPTIPKNTLAEDFELAMISYRGGLTSSFEPNATVYTEPASSWRDLYKQRIRWYYGGLQVMAKYRDMIMNWKYGEKGLFLFFHMILLEYILPILQIFGIIAFPFIIILQDIFNIEILDIALPFRILLTVSAIVLLLQYLPGVIMSSIVVTLEMGKSKTIKYIPAIFLYHIFYNPLLSLAKIDGMIRLLRGVVQPW